MADFVVSAVAKQNPSTTLLGSSLEDEATILRWSSFANSELLPPIMAWINPVIGKAPSSAEILAAAEKGCEPMVEVVARELKGGSKFLVGNGLTMADLFVVAALARGYQFVSLIFSLQFNDCEADLDDRCLRKSGQRSIRRSTITTGGSNLIRFTSRWMGSRMY